MSQSFRLVAAFATFLVGITVLNGSLNQRWFEHRERAKMTVGYLPVT